jgi:hypothetical protein
MPQGDLQEIRYFRWITSATKTGVCMMIVVASYSIPPAGRSQHSSVMEASSIMAGAIVRIDFYHL